MRVFREKEDKVCTDIHGEVEGLASKVRAQKIMCQNCGEDFGSDIGYCAQCGKSSRAGALNPTIGPHLHEYEDDDVPIRASNFMWMDGLLSTELWYIPVLLILNGVFAVLLFSPSIHIDRVLVLIAATIATAIVLLIAWKRH